MLHAILLINALATVAASVGSCYNANGDHAVVCNVAEADCGGTFYEPGYTSSRSGCCHCEGGCDTAADGYPTDCTYYEEASVSDMPTSAGSCYNANGDHAVECDVAEADCGGTYYEPGYLSSYSGCCHCQASCESVSDECSYYDAAPTSAGSCYNARGDHGVDCDVAEADCGGTYYDPGYTSSYSGCCHCAASCETITDGCSYYDVEETEHASGAGSGEDSHSHDDDSHSTDVDDSGCYSMTTHTCDCEVTETTCTDYWTPGCGCTPPDDSGCYDMTSHTCDCEVGETACTGYWTPGCGCVPGDDDHHDDHEGHDHGDEGDMNAGSEDAMYAVVLTLTAAGTVDDYPASVQADIGANAASAAGVDVDAVTVSVESASVIITISIEVEGASAAAAMESGMTAAMSSPAAAELALGIASVESIDSIGIEDAPTNKGGDDDAAAEAPIGAIVGGAAGGAVVLGAVAYFFCFTKKKEEGKIPV